VKVKYENLKKFAHQNLKKSLIKATKFIEYLFLIKLDVDKNFVDQD
jgi:hypothetical protein